MKKIAFAFALILFTFRSTAQNSTADEQAISMLKQFYTLYNITWYSSANKIPFKLLQAKLDVLRKKYCTQKLYTTIKHNDWDHDFLIYDMYTDSAHLKTLTVIKDPTQSKHYIVSYTALRELGKIKELKMVFDIGVEKEDGDFKISTLYNDTKNP